jgi:hypothetical protein
LQETELAQAQATTIRLKVLKMGALMRVTVRKVWIALAGGYLYAHRSKVHPWTVPRHSAMSNSAVESLRDHLMLLCRDQLSWFLLSIHSSTWKRDNSFARFQATQE